jgi:hypothetical protein
VDEIWSVLGDVTYPVAKDALIAKATGADAREDLIHRIYALPDTTFDDEAHLGRALARTRASSNPALVTIDAEPCPNCGFLLVPGRAHSCIEEKARFAEAAQSITNEFETLDDSREN